MPLVTTWHPDYEKLPKELFGGLFTLIVNPPGEPKSDYYLFHDGKWMANSTHMLGWARELIHCLENRHEPDWLFGHAFERVKNHPKWWGKLEKMTNLAHSYKVSGTGNTLLVRELLNWARIAQKQLEEADVTTCQWGSESHEDWPDAIKREHDNVVRHHSEKFHRELVGDDVKFHVIRANEANAVHHEEYPK